MKFECPPVFNLELLSPSSRGRGLKFLIARKNTKSETVALFTRAWIEIMNTALDNKVDKGRPLHEGVD